MSEQIVPSINKTTGKPYEPLNSYINSLITPVNLNGTEDITSLGVGDYIVSNDKKASSLGLPDYYPGYLQKIDIGNNGSIIKYKSLREGNFYKYKVQGIWGDWVKDFSEYSSNVDLYRRDVIKQNLLSRKGGRIFVGDKGVICIRLDDYPEEAREFVIPLLHERGLPFTRVSTSYSVHEEIISDEEFTQMQEYCIRSGGEVWNHGRTHKDASGQNEIYKELVGSLYELRSKLPRIPIDCFCPPGGGRVFDGYNQGNSPESVFGTFAGQILMSHHALLSGYYNNSYYYNLDGQLKDGMRFYTADTWNYNRVIKYIDYAKNWNSGVVLMWHPRFIGTDGNMSKQDFIKFLDKLVEARDNGKIEVLTMTGMAVADCSIDYRKNLLSKSYSDTTFYDKIEFSNYRTDILGATVCLQFSVDASVGDKITSTIGTSTKETVINKNGISKIYHCYTIPLDSPNDIEVSINSKCMNAKMYHV